MSMEGGASGSAAMADAAMAEAGAVDPDLALGVYSLLSHVVCSLCKTTMLVNMVSIQSIHFGSGKLLLASVHSKTLSYH